ncbi:MAG: hypothetical protein AB8G95_04070 [Anaerolineae bacterium]
MSIKNHICPHCGELTKWTIKASQINYPPTGKNYDWAEVGATATCPACQKDISTRVSINLSNSKVSSILYWPFPKVENKTYYVIASVRNHIPTSTWVQVLHISETLEDAESMLQNGENASYWTIVADILILDHTGYRYLDGTLLHPSANGRINYDYR